MASDRGVLGQRRRRVCSRSTLKTEFYNRRDWPTKAEARLAVGAWIEERYNRLRRHSSIGMISPLRFEELHTQTAKSRLNACPPDGVSPC